MTDRPVSLDALARAEQDAQLYARPDEAAMFDDWEVADGDEGDYE